MIHLLVHNLSELPQTEFQGAPGAIFKALRVHPAADLGRRHENEKSELRVTVCTWGERMYHFDTKNSPDLKRSRRVDIILKPSGSHSEESCDL